MRLSRRLANRYFKLAGIPSYFIEVRHKPYWPGTDLETLLRRGMLPSRAITEAGRRYRAIHDRGWTHGDAAMSNVLWDDEYGIILIDFELQHDSSVGWDWSAANDVAVFLLDILSLSDEPMTLSLLFLEAYNDHKLWPAVLAQLWCPKGLAQIAWRYRTSFVAPKKVHGRVVELAATIERGIPELDKEEG